ncbi:DMT family transporter [Clostridium sp.]|uniref:DMT family transporter n=1 Tax=Clostridium sp. TaxID=1506 RepID=UPI003F3F345F
MKKRFEQYMMLVATMFWAGAFVAGKFSIAEFPVFSLVFFRFLIATVIIFIIMVRVEDDWKITKDDFKMFLILGIVGMIGYHVFFFLSLKYTSATNSSLIGATNPIVTTILAFVFLKERVSYRSLVGILISLFGVMLITTNGDMNLLFSFKFNSGDILMIIAVICWAAYGILSKKALELYSPIKITGYSFLTCVVLLIPFVIFEKPWVYLPNTTISGWSSVFYMAIFPSVFGYLIQQISIKKIGPTKTSLYINLVPVFSMVLAFFILGETISFIKIVAGVFIISGICINIMNRKVELTEEIKASS